MNEAGGNTMNNVKSTRLSKGLTQKQLAEQCNISLSQVKRIENGNVNQIKIGTIAKLSDVLNTPISVLFNV